MSSVLPTILGSIPARAGEPGTQSTSCQGMPVYPRACGGTGNKKAAAEFAKGLSPRVRGNPDLEYFVVFDVRSIPARAGEPLPERRFLVGHEVYPRACGGTQLRRPLVLRQMGLSPRVRGNRSGESSIPWHEGSIPARAGGTPFQVVGILSVKGLSPRVRGNRSAQIFALTPAWSIPARAGEPTCWRPWACLRAVYPRACGGTYSAVRSLSSSSGLSPRVRGNPP